MAKYNWKISKEKKRRIAKYYVENNSTVRKTAEHFGISKSYVHRALIEFQMDSGTAGSELAHKVEMQINNNVTERAKRGGMATKAKYERKTK